MFVWGHGVWLSTFDKMSPAEASTPQRSLDPTLF
jgi:hypothetical protein